MHAPVRNTFVAGCAFAIAMGGAACNGNNRADNRTNPNTAATPAADRADQKAQPTPISLSGCLQKGPGMSEYILTQVNRENGPVATSGSAASDRVERAEINAAEHSYRLEGDKDQLKDLVGKQVRVSGTVVERSDLDKKVADARDHNDKAAATSGSNANDNDRDRVKVDDDDLAKVSVSSIDKISDACGSAKAPAASKGKAERHHGAKK